LQNKNETGLKQPPSLLAGVQQSGHTKIELNNKTGEVTMYRVKASSGYREANGTLMIPESDFSSAKAALDHSITMAITGGRDNTISFIDTRSAIQPCHRLASVNYIDIDLTEWPDGMTELIDAVKAATGKKSDIVAKQHCSLTNCTRIWKKGYTEIERMG
jgi:hypothetical protein